MRAVLILPSLVMFLYLSTGRRLIGFAAKKRGSLDGAKVYTFVFMRPFRRRGVITGLRLYSGSKRRPLSIAVFRRLSRKGCRFRVVQRVNFRRLRRLGLVKVRHMHLERGQPFTNAVLWCTFESVVCWFLS